jgi:MFS family permease
MSAAQPQPEPTDEFQQAVQPSLLRNREFLAIWGAQVLSQTAANALTASLIVLVFSQTRANAASSLLILLAIIPAVIFGPLAGIMVDRTDLKLVLVTTNVLRALAVILMVPLSQSVAAAYFVNFLVSAVTVFFVPAEAATLPKIVRKRDLLAANSLFSLTFNGSFFLGFVVVAPLGLRLWGFDALFLLLTATYGVAAGLCWLLPKAEPLTVPLRLDVAGEAWKQTRSDVAEAFTYLRARGRVLWVLLYVALTFMLIAVAGALAPGFVTEALGLHERDIYVLSFSASVGVALGLILLNLVGRHLPRPRMIHWGLLTTAGALTALAASGPALRLFRQLIAEGDPQPIFVGIVMVTSVVFGAAYIFITVPAFTLLHEELHDDIRGRVFSVLNTLVSIVSLAPLILVGTVADEFGVGWVFAAAAAVVFLVWFAGRDAHLPDYARRTERMPAP